MEKREAKRILFYGDSNTYGFDPADWYEGRYPADVRWTDRLSKKLEGRFCIFADGMNGRCIPDSEYAFESLGMSIRRNAPLDLFAVMLGTNDFLNMPDPDPSEVGAKMSRLIRWLKSGEGIGEMIPQILVIAPPAIDASGVRQMSMYDTTDGSLSEALKKAALSEGALFLDAAKWNVPVTYDRVHLSEEGHILFAKKMEEWLCIRENR